MEQWEKIIKGAREPGKGSWCYVDLPMYAKLTSGRRLLSLSAGIRDWVHPHQYIRVDISDDGCIRLTRTDNCKELKTVICNGQMRIGSSGIKYSKIRDDVRYYAVQQDGDSIILKAGD